VFLASENIDFTGLAHVFLLGGGEISILFLHFFAAGNHFSKITSDYMVQISGK